MSGNNYWKKVNLDILASLGEEMDSDAKSGKYLEAVMLQFCLIETEMRYYILRKVEHFQEDERLIKYYSSEMTSFAVLVDYLELLQGNPRLISSLRKYNANRVEIVHKVMFFSSTAELQKRAEATHRMGLETLKLLINDVNQEMKQRDHSGVEDTMEIAMKRGLLVRYKNCNHVRVSHIDTPSLKESDREKTIEELSKRCTLKGCECLNFMATERKQI